MSRNSKLPSHNETTNQAKKQNGGRFALGDVGLVGPVDSIQQSHSEQPQHMQNHTVHTSRLLKAQALTMTDLNVNEAEADTTKPHTMKS